MINITIDTREQRPWHFPDHLVRVCRGKLDAGDYALEDDVNFAIERKSLDDFIGTISSGWSRFKRELIRMRDYPARIIIVESDFESICFREWDGEIISPDHNHWRITPQFIISRMALMALNEIQVLFAGCPEYAAALCFRILKQRHDQLNGMGEML